MTPNGAIMVDLFGPCTGLEAVEILFWQTAPPDQIIITRDIVVVAAMPDHAAEVGAWFDDALDRMGETGDLVQRERLSLIYLTMAYFGAVEMVCVYHGELPGVTPLGGSMTQHRNLPVPLDFPEQPMLIEHILNGDVIPQRPRDGYINATLLCQKSGRRLVTTAAWPGPKPS